MFSPMLVLGLIALIIVCLLLLYKGLTRSPLLVIRGPKASSFIFGNLLELSQRPVGETEFEWQSQYGNIIRFKSILGGNQLLVLDPRALQKILNTSGYDYTKLPRMRAISRIMSGKGLFWADGEDHKRHRKIMLPAFGSKESKAYLPIFKECAESVGMKWIEMIENTNGQGVVLDVRTLLSLSTLDAIGQAAFDVRLDTIRDDSHPLAKAYKNYFGDIFGSPSTKQIFMQAASAYTPTWILEKLYDYSSDPRVVRAREARVAITRVAEELVQEKAHALLQGKGSRDAFTLLVKANMDADAKNKLTDEELFAQMRTILVAGHETVATTISWILFELARNRNIQSKLREEIRKTMAVVQARNDPQLTVVDLDAMPYLNAVIKEGLRFHPALPAVHRVSPRDDIIPLSKPICTEHGEMINKIVVPKDTHIMISIAAYNRNKDLWGEDAHVFNPDRWLNGVVDETNAASVGVYSNLMTFLSGVRACLGWRFALVEVQVFLLELLGKFEFGTADATKRIVRTAALVMTPVIEEGPVRSIQMPLVVSLAPQDDEV